MKDSNRHKALEKLRILDTLPDRAYDDIAFLASKISLSPIAVITFLDRTRLWFKARVGTLICQVLREGSPCDIAIRTEQILVVRDIAVDPRFCDGDLVAEGIRFYAGVPLILGGGEAIGTLCVLDTKPKDISETEISLLQVLARQVCGELERRLATFQLEDSNQSLEASKNSLRVACRTYGGFRNPRPTADPASAA